MTVYKNQQLHEVGRDGQLTLRALDLQESEKWLENEKKADAEDPDDTGEFSLLREHQHQPIPRNFRLAAEYKDTHGRLVARIKAPYEGSGPNLFKFCE